MVQEWTTSLNTILNEVVLASVVERRRESEDEKVRREKMQVREKADTADCTGCTDLAVVVPNFAVVVGQVVLVPVAVVASKVVSRKASKFELQELWVRFFAQRKVLVILGDDFWRREALEKLRSLTATASSAAVRYVTLEALRDGVAGALSELRRDAVAFDLALLLGFPGPLGALLSAGLDCVIQAVDGGMMDVGPAGWTARPEPAPLRSIPRRTEAEPREPMGHPRPQLQRKSRWLSLDGPWDVSISTETTDLPSAFEDGVIQVPFPVESHQGGWLRVSEFELLWLRRRLQPPAWRRALLHLDGCDWECSVFVNGRLLGVHRGAYDPFSLELPMGAEAMEIVIRVWDPSDSGCEPRSGKLGGQCPVTPLRSTKSTSRRAVTGPWQSIWLEEVPLSTCLIRTASAELAPPVELAAAVVFEVVPHGSCDSGTLRVDAVALGGTALGVQVTAGSGLTTVVTMPVQLWSPESPTMYTAELSLCAEHGCDRGRQEEVALLLNGEALLQTGRFSISMGCGAGKVGPGSKVAPVSADVTDTSPNGSRPVLERHPDRSAWGKLMVGFLMAKLDRLVQEALAGLKQDDCELFAHHIDREFSEEHLRLHRQFLSSLEQLLEASLGGLGISLSEVAELLHQEAERDTEARYILQQLLLYTELQDFARVMRQRSWGRVSEVRVYWDIQNVGGEVMEGDSARMIRTLMTFLKENYMLSGNVDMWAVAPSHYYARKQTMVRDLNEFGITVVHCSDKAENADHLIKHRIEKDLTMMEKLQLPPRETAFILISSDKDFMDILRKLFFNGHKTVLIHDAEKKGEKKSEHEEKVTFFSTESFVFSDIVKWELVHQRNAWQSLMAWASSMVQPGVRIKHLKEKVEEQGRAKWRCTLEVEFDRRNRLFLSEGLSVLQQLAALGRCAPRQLQVRRRSRQERHQTPPRSFRA
eukprot:s577_g1.t1